MGGAEGEQWPKTMRKWESTREEEGTVTRCRTYTHTHKHTDADGAAEELDGVERLQHTHPRKYLVSSLEV